MPKISDFDTAYTYKGYVLVNELYPDDEGFNKNWWQYGIQAGDHVAGLKILEGLSSNAYADTTEAFNVFKNMVDSK